VGCPTASTRQVPSRARPSHEIIRILGLENQVGILGKGKEVVHDSLKPIHFIGEHFDAWANLRRRNHRFASEVLNQELKANADRA
jgi:hypothetical protein